MTADTIFLVIESTDGGDRAWYDNALCSYTTHEAAQAECARLEKRHAQLKEMQATYNEAHRAFNADWRAKLASGTMSPNTWQDERSHAFNVTLQKVIAGFQLNDEERIRHTHGSYFNVEDASYEVQDLELRN